MAGERQQLAAIGAVIGKLDATLDDLFRSVAELKTSLGLPAPQEVAVTAPGPEPAPQGALERAQALQVSLDAMSETLKAVIKRLGSAEKTARLLKRIVIALSVSFCLDILITAGLGWNSVQAHSASDRANATVADLHSAQITNCRAGNQTRAQQVQLWTHLAQESKPAPGATAAQIAKDRQAVDALLAYIGRVFAPVNCAERYRLP